MKLNAPSSVRQSPRFDRPPRVGFFNSIPWIPCFTGRREWDVSLVSCESSGVRDLALQGKLDITPMATVDWFMFRGEWTRLKNWGIAILERADSVLFFSNTPIEELDDADVAICDQTSTSVRVLQAIMVKKYGLRIGRWRRNVDIFDSETPRLLIQNQAVEEAARNRFRFVYDLGTEWSSWQGTPIVSAVWVHRTGTDAQTVAALDELLTRSIDRYRADPVAAIEAHRREFGWTVSAESVRTLHANFEYELGEAAERGIDRMCDILQERIVGFDREALAA